MKKLLLLPLLLVAVSCTPAAAPSTDDQAMHSEEHSMHGGEASTAMSQDRLNNSPRHQEWVEVKNGDKTIHTWVVYPEVSEKKPVVILIHENRGLNDWVRGMADQVAEAGYIAVAPDLLSGFSEEYERTSDFPNEDAARDALGQLDLNQTMSDLQAVADWSKTIPASDGTLVSAGFCWGGARSFQFATVSDDLDATLVFYGTGPEQPADYAKIDSPVFGFYGGADERVNATIPQSEQYMTAANKSFDYEIYEGAGHAFMRSGEDPSGEAPNVAARNAAWERMKEILAGL
jgi:carboxymethylenebutenolidase